MAFFRAAEFHEGEKMVQSKLRVPVRENPTVTMLSPQAAHMLQIAPLLAVGTLDSEGRPWTTLWGGKAGLAAPLGSSIIGMRAPVAAVLDPVVEALVGSNADGEIVKQEGAGKLVSGLAIDLESRKRVKFAGKMIAGSLQKAAPAAAAESTDPEQQDAHGASHDLAAPETDDTAKAVHTDGLLQLAVAVDESLGNCPKYLNKKHLTPARTASRLISDAVPLSSEAVDVIHRSDLFFMTTKHSHFGMDTNHRGGAPGFVRVMQDGNGATVIVYPEYSGNRLYQSLGNMILDPEAGICFPDFDSGDCVYTTGTTEILFGKDAADIIPRSNLVVKLTVTATRHVANVLPFRGSTGEASPYNPTVRYLKTEKADPNGATTSAEHNTAKLLEQVKLSPSISRFRFALANPASYQAGQFVTLDFSEHLDIGYSHMRDDDPRSLNDDFVRTFTVSSPTGLPADPARRLKDDEFELTLRRVGVVTGFLFDHKGQIPLEVGVKGFGGSFMVTQEHSDTQVAFIAAGVGITPLMPSLGSLDLGRLKLLWTMRADDVGLAIDMLRQHPALASSTSLFVTGDDAIAREHEEYLKSTSAVIQRRRLAQDDVEALLPGVKRFYVCTGGTQRSVLLQWLEGQEVLYEDYNF